MTKQKKLTFRLRDRQDEHIVKWPVSWYAPDGDGEIMEVGFTAHFKVLPEAEVHTLFGGDTVFGLFTDPKRNRKGLEAVLVNWSGVERPDGKAEAPFTPEARDELLAWTDALNGCVKAYVACLQGHKEKN